MNNQSIQEEKKCVVSIIIKALNEEKKISIALESALKAIEKIGGEVILADSMSTDNTIQIAQRYPIKIVQLSNANERCCGIGPQLGYQYSQGEFVYILDGDMQMLETFLPKALEFIQKKPEVAGVGGKVIEMNTESLEFQARVERAAEHMYEGQVDRLAMGGLYRKKAVDSVGHFSDRNLHSYEELDLAVRLRAKNWQLHRIDEDAVRHWGHDAPPYQLLLKRWTSGYIKGVGEILRASVGKSHFKLLLKDVTELRLYGAVILWWFSLISITFLNISILSKSTIAIAILAIPLLLITIKKKSLIKGIYSVVSWNVNTLGLIRGFFANRNNSDTIDSIEIPTKTV
ncbi:glycosyltransferase [Paraglaciecola sp.]|uniref:glycosyltransferase n=1 Tax=Paraglaciecola sp. TaxID=1920173 RepID=UPI00326665B4